MFGPVNNDQEHIAFIALTLGGAALARRLARELPGAEVHLPAGIVEGGDNSVVFTEPLREALPRLFASRRALVCIMAAGIVVRLLAPHLKGKGCDPAVVVMDEAGEFAVSLLSGHLGGANELAREIARVIGATAVITTATDVNGLPAWDEAARIEGLAVEPIGHLRTLNAMLLRGEKIGLVDPAGRIRHHFSDLPAVTIHPELDGALRSEAAGVVLVTHRLVPEVEGRRNLLLLRPRDLVAGIGCNRGTQSEQIEAAVREVLAEADLAFSSVAAVATVADKRDEEGLTEFARRWRLPIDYHEAAALNAVAAPSAPSPHALTAVGAKGVCEPAAILSARAGALLVKKQKRGNVTVAVAHRAQASKVQKV